MNATPRSLHSLDAWPGETARPPLRLLEVPRAKSGANRSGDSRPLMASWLQRLRSALMR